MMKTPFTTATITRFFQGSLDAETHQEILDWLSTLPKADQYRFFDLHVDYLDHHDNLLKEAPDNCGFEQVRITIEDKRITKKARLYNSLSIAAAIIPFLVAYFLIYQPQKQHNKISKIARISSNYKKQIANEGNVSKDIMLPDSSTVTLNPGAMIEYETDFISAKREVNLIGKAFFKVTHDVDHPFIVHTGQLQTVVLGTSFWIDAEKASKEISVTVKSGKVGVFSNKSSTVFLLPGEAVVFNLDTEHLQKVSSQKRSLYKNPQQKTLLMPTIAFNQTPLAQVLKVLGEQFHVGLSLTAKGKGDLQITLNTAGKSLQAILQEINLQIPPDETGTRVNVIINKTQQIHKSQ